MIHGAPWNDYARENQDRLEEILEDGCPWDGSCDDCPVPGGKHCCKLEDNSDDE